MKYEEMVATLKKPGQDLLDSWTPEKASAMHMLVGLHDEALELQVAVGKQDIPNLIEELGDMLFYTVGLGQDLGITLDLNVEPEPVEDDSAMLNVVTLCKRHLCYNKDLDLEMLKENLLSIVKTLAWVGGHAGVTLKEIQEQNYEKLMKKRYPDGYSDEAANNRLDTKPTKA